MSARLRLRRADGEVHLDRWGIEWKPLGGIFIHRMDAPDPGLDVHDHPWAFVSLVLAGGYTEERAATRDAPMFAKIAEQYPATCQRGCKVERRRFSIKVMRLDECHRITKLHRSRSWSLLIHGPVRRPWGFYLPSGYMHWREYDKTVRAERRDMFEETRVGDAMSTRYFPIEPLLVYLRKRYPDAAYVKGDTGTPLHVLIGWDSTAGKQRWLRRHRFGWLTAEEADAIGIELTGDPSWVWRDWYEGGSEPRCTWCGELLDLTHAPGLIACARTLDRKRQWAHEERWDKVGARVSVMTDNEFERWCFGAPTKQTMTVAA